MGDFATGAAREPGDAPLHPGMGVPVPLPGMRTPLPPTLPGHSMPAALQLLQPEHLPAACFYDLVDGDRGGTTAVIGLAGRRDAFAGKRHKSLILTFGRHGF